MFNFIKWLFFHLLSPSAAHYINGGPSLPPPLTPEQEKALLTRMMAGDAAARDDLITHNLRLVVYLAKKYENSGVPQEDMISIGTIGLIKAVDSFDYSKGTRLSTYASRCVENEILMYFRSLKKQNGEVFMGDAIDTDKDGNPLTVEDVISDDRDIVEEIETKRRWLEVKKLIENMEDDREKEIIILRYGLNNAKPLTQREVAQRLNISRSYVSRIEKKILQDLKKKVN